MANLFQVKLKVFEPNKPNVKFKPATVTVLVGVTKRDKAVEMATKDMLTVIHKKFPTADVKLADCKPINYDHFIKFEKGGKNEN